MQKSLKEAIKEQLNADKERDKAFKKEHNKIHSKEAVKDPNSLAKKRESVLNYYNSLNDSDKKSLANEFLKKKIRKSFPKYLKYVYGDFYKMTKFHSLLAKIGNLIIKDIEAGKSKTYCISVPPQHGKSITITETLPAFFLGRHPDEGAIVISYDAGTAERFGNSNREKIREFNKKLFEEEISEEFDTKTEFHIKDHHGQMVSTGIFGKITGNKASLIIVDDPYKSKLESESPTYRKKVRDVVFTCAETRLRPTGSALVIIHTRWHEDDLIGTYLGFKDTVYINVPAVWESRFGEDKLLKRKVGEVLCPEFNETASWYEDKKAKIGLRDFNALYQGTPFVDGGNIVQRDSLRFYGSADLPTEFDDVTLSADLSLGGTSNESDPACFSVWGRKGANHYLLKVVNKKMGFNEQINTINNLCDNYQQINRKIVEKKANGSAVIETLNKQISGIIPYDPKGANKTSRLEAVTHFFEAGNIWFPNEKVMPNIEEFVEQLLKFPNAKHDDFVDTLSQYLLNYEYRNVGRIQTNDYFARISDYMRGIKI